jgi:hypothetical protein
MLHPPPSPLSGDQTQDLRHARQVLYHWAASSCEWEFEQAVWSGN